MIQFELIDYSPQFSELSFEYQVKGEYEVILGQKDEPNKGNFIREVKILRNGTDITLEIRKNNAYT